MLLPQSVAPCRMQIIVPHLLPAGVGMLFAEAITHNICTAKHTKNYWRMECIIKVKEKDMIMARKLRQTQKVLIYSCVLFSLYFLISILHLTWLCVVFLVLPVSLSSISLWFWLKHLFMDNISFLYVFCWLLQEKVYTSKTMTWSWLKHKNVSKQNYRSIWRCEIISLFFCCASDKA